MGLANVRGAKYGVALSYTAEPLESAPAPVTFGNARARESLPKIQLSGFDTHPLRCSQSGNTDRDFLMIPLYKTLAADFPQQLPSQGRPSVMRDTVSLRNLGQRWYVQPDASLRFPSYLRCSSVYLSFQVLRGMGVFISCETQFVAKGSRPGKKKKTSRIACTRVRNQLSTMLTRICP